MHECMFLMYLNVYDTWTGQTGSLRYKLSSGNL